jgi:hypothetical protein
VTQAISTRRDGDRFQARLFWKKAARMLIETSNIARVGFEVGPKSFDDIWVDYLGYGGPIDHEGVPVARDHYQCKWHVTLGQYGYRDLILPEFINADAHSLLQRARQAQLLHAPEGTGCRFHLYTNWRIAYEDPLRELIHRRANNLRLDKLYAGTTAKSASGLLRKTWCEHLDIPDEALRLLARTLAFSETTESLEEIRERLNELFATAGLRQVPANESAFMYDEVIFQWMAQGRTEFDRSSFYAACEKEGLLEKGSPNPIVYGVKSFEHPTDPLEERCTSVLNLLPKFYERQIRPESNWTTNLYPELRKFLIEAVKAAPSLRLALDAHLTLAVAAGTILNVKSGRSIEIEQRTNDRRIWTATDEESNPAWPSLAFASEEMDQQSVDLVVTVGLTHDPLPMVKSYIAKAGMRPHTRLSALPTTGPASASVQCGRHAVELAEQLVDRIAQYRAEFGFDGLVHLFMAVPNAFAFFLGQRLTRVGRVKLYEYDFEGQHGGSYESSLDLPVAPETI